MHRKRPDAEPRGQPHEDKHADADLGVDVELLLGLGGVLEGDADDGADGAGGQDEHHLEEGGDGQRQTPPARGHGQRREEDHQEGEHGGGEEEAEHDLGGEAQDVEDGDDLRGEGDGGAGEQFVHENLDRVEPVQGGGLGAEGDARADVALAEVPQADLVEVVQADGLGDAVDQASVGH
ncbi:hypothetical protein CHGG_00622 [Chaetomium globosum CBS 148.51]|uniref:Uncharacterized protein n=1 Tax=Chaetomium globosum (strain ATCC 6205 / CBS 148.51 / DSM 1962 / NBRC 6347 / NRRL 1970) TaxID=306901 RepID=Q2HGN2_CHAGB|nr:uncharacterized protein CHGG_00622 [Chaetomium globosum CBS 148.51]EAQ92387.1 hypothetical protein CHGG_00622 [Chaetomium globosum CBS 148.51]